MHLTTVYIQEALLLQMDRMTHYVSQKLKILSIVDTRCTTNLTQIKSRLVVNSHNLPTVIQVSSTSSIIDNDREVLLTARSTCCGEIFFTESGVWDKVPEGCTLIFEDTQISL